VGERDASGRFVRRDGAAPSRTTAWRDSKRAAAAPAELVDVAADPGESVSRETPPTGAPIRLRLLVDDVTPAAPGAGGGSAPPPLELPPEAAGDGVDVDTVPLYEAAVRGLDWGIGQRLGPEYAADEAHLDAVAAAAAPLARRLGDLVGAAELADAAVPPIVRELVTFAAAVYVAWGDAVELAAREAWHAYRNRGEDDADAEDRPTRVANDGARRRSGRDRRPVDAPAGVGGADEDPSAAGIRPPGPSEGRSADLAGAFTFGRSIGSGAG
jgi:hypothetical protein